MKFLNILQSYATSNAVAMTNFGGVGGSITYQELWEYSDALVAYIKGSSVSA